MTRVNFKATVRIRGHTCKVLGTVPGTQEVWDKGWLVWLSTCFPSFISLFRFTSCSKRSQQSVFCPEMGKVTQGERHKGVWMGGEAWLQLTEGEVADWSHGKQDDWQEQNAPFSPHASFCLLNWPWLQDSQRIQVPVEVIALLSARVGLIKEIGCRSRKGSAGSSKLEQEFN